MRLSNRVVVVTGASKGLGREIAFRLNRMDADVILVARSRDLLEQAGRNMKKDRGRTPTIITCDVSKEDDVAGMADAIRSRWDHVDALVNNAGVGIYRTVEEMTGTEMAKQFEVNMYGPFYCIKALLPLLKKSDSGYILNIGSLFGKTALADNSIYAATKFALSGFSEGLRREMKRHRIRVGLFLPGPMDTSFRDNRGDSALKPPKLITLNPARVAETVEKMIVQRRDEVYLHRWMLWGMKMKQLFA